MISYSAKYVFSRDEQQLLSAAERIIWQIPQIRSIDQLRCHEVTRAVAEIINQSSNWKLCTVDGKFGYTDHSWIPLSQRTILDVYAVGRLPQVQLVSSTANFDSIIYHPGMQRRDIDAELVQELIKSYFDHV